MIWLRSLLLALVMPMVFAVQANADDETEDPTQGESDVSLLAAITTNQLDGDQAYIVTPASSGDGPTWTYLPSCGAGGHYVCYEPTICSRGETEGLLYDVLRDGEFIGQTCVTDQEAAEQEQVTPGRVLRAFRRLSWPQSDLVVQPPGGTTLVNFPTNFYTDNATPTRQQVTLLRQRVLIEATPTTYTWHYGDGASASTDIPGAPYPTLAVTHDYLSVDTFRTRLDTTYTGRYRLNGGPWITIPETLTVTGASQPLETIEASPTLVSY
jgi:hypothetical protein